MIKDSDIENLVFAGGGLKGLIHIGFLQVLQERGILSQCKRFCGTSIGSFFALLVCLGIKVDDIEKLFLCIDPKNIVQFNPENLINLFDTLGCEKTDALENILHIILEKKTNNPRITFRELYELTNKELCFSVTNISKKCGEFFNYNTTPDLEVAEGCLISMCIPFLFEPRLYNNCYYLDGGIANNFPIEYFHESISKTLGIGIKDDVIIDPEPLPNDVISLFLTVYKSTINERSTIKYNMWEDNMVCVINDYPPYKFDLPTSAKIKFIKSGRDNTIEFFKRKSENEMTNYVSSFIQNIIADVLEL